MATAAVSLSMRDHALAWAARGFRVFPLRAGTKLPIETEFYAKASSDPEAVAAMWTDPVTGWVQAHNIGVSTDDMIVVDIDEKKGKNGLTSYLALDLPLDTLMVKTPTGGYHAYFSGPSRSLSVDKYNGLGSGLDIRSFHGYVIAPGSVLPDLGEYVLDSDCAICPVPPHLLAKLDEPRERKSLVASTELDTEFALARAAKYLATEAPPAVEGMNGDDTTFRVACIVKDMGLSEYAAFEAMLENWNERCAPPWSPEELATKVSNAFQYSLSAAGSQSPVVDLAGIEDMPEPVYVREPNAPTDRRWQQHGDDIDYDAAWLYYEMLPQQGVGVLSGPSQGGKTFVAMHLARSLATGKKFFGIEPDERAGTILLTGEGRRSVLARMQALDEPGKLAIVSGDINNLAEPGALDALAADLRGKMDEMLCEFDMPVRLIVIDTLSASGLLRDENDNSEAGIAMKALSKLSEMLDAFVLVTHHPPKNGSGQRGAGAIYNDVDVVLEITREKTGSIRELAISKSRDAQQRSLGVFTLIPKVLGHDARGRAVTSCYVSDAPPTARDVTSTPKHVEALVQAIEWGLVDDPEEIDGDPAVAMEVVKGKFPDLSPGSKDASNINKRWVPALSWALESGAVQEVAFAGKRYLRLPSFSP